MSFTQTEEKINKCIMCNVEGRQNPLSPFTLAEQFIICWYKFEDGMVCSDMCWDRAKVEKNLKNNEIKNIDTVD